MPEIPAGVSASQPWDSAPKKKVSYLPFFETLRLYAGWVLFWCCLLLTAMAYGEVRHLSFQIPYIQDIAELRSVVIVACASFLFLLLHRIHKKINGGMVFAILGFVIWFFALIFFMQNV